MRRMEERADCCRWRFVRRKGLDLHFASRREAKLWCQLRQAEVEPQSIGLWHVDGFETLLDTIRKADIPNGISAFLVRRKGLEPPTY